MSTPETLPERTPVRRMPKPAHDGRYYATGRRKRATARVFLKAGSGTITVNGRSFEDYFAGATSRLIVQQPLEAVEGLAHAGGDGLGLVEAGDDDADLGVAGALAQDGGGCRGRFRGRGHPEVPCEPCRSGCA